jgi:formate/nitrite transporter
VGETIVSVATAKAGLAPSVVFFRGILCNILVCLAVWMGFAGTSVTDKFMAAVVPVAGFVACGYEHCVANMFFIPLGMLTQGAIGLDSITMAGMVSNIVFATLGNIVGGAIIVAATYWYVYGKKK